MKPDDWYYTFKLDEKNQKTELYYGNGFNSSSTRKIQIPQGATEIFVYKFDGGNNLIGVRHRWWRVIRTTTPFFIWLIPHY
jgi:hypothetical protein